MTIQTTKIPRRQKCVDKDHPYIGGSVDIIDDSKNKTQEQINSETEERVSTLEESVGTGGSVDERIAEEGAKHYLKTETYSKTELNNMITTPNQEFVSVVATDQTTAATDVLPATGEADTIYRVGNWDGSQYDDTVYSEYSWNGSAYVKLSTKSQVGEVYDISANHAGATYADLSAALGTNGANIPQSLRKGGMSVKYVQSSDNKYVQYRLMPDSWSINTDDWSFCVDNVLIENLEWIYVLLDAENRILAGLKSDGSVEWSIGIPTPVKKYIDDAIAEIKNGTEGTDLDGLNKIIAFLSDFSTSDTLKDLLDTKVDKEEGKALIDSEYAEGIRFVEKPEFIEVHLDAEYNILWAVKKDGNIYYGAGVPPQIIDYINKKIAELSLDEYEDIVAFLNGIELGDKTLPEYISEFSAKQTKLITDDNLEISNPLPEGYIALENITGNSSTCRIDTGIQCNDNLEIECVFIDSNRISYGNFFGRYTDENTDALRLIYGQSSTGDGAIVSFNSKASSSANVSGVTPNTKHHIILNKQKFVLDDVITTLNLTQHGSTQEGTIIINGTNLTAGSGTRTITWWAFIIRNTDGDVLFNGLPCKRLSDGAVGLYDQVTNSFFGNAMENDDAFTAGNEINHIKIKNPTSLQAITNLSDSNDRLELKLDSEEKIVSYRDKEGVLHEEVGVKTPVVNTPKIDGLTEDGFTTIANGLKEIGFTGGQGDWTDYLSNDGENPFCIPEPRCAILNIISDFNLNNLNKKGYNASSQEGVNYDIPTQVEFWDMQGNYFKKWTLMSAQGSSSMGYTKKNIAFDFFDSEAGGDAFAIKFGDWVPQDSFHLKAYMVDFFKGLSVVSYKLAEQVAKTRPYLEDTIWKRGLYKDMTFTPSIYTTEQIDDMNLRLDNGAKCQPAGFPVIVYQNGVFHGVFAWMIKKHRDNYLMNKSNPNHIHLDGQYYTHKLFNGDLDWSTFEVRNPKNLVYAVIQTFAETGEQTYKYDADIAQAEIAGNSDGSTSYDTWAAGTYAIGKIVTHNGHLFMNTIADNSAEPVYHSKNNADDSPDFKNKTACGWLNVTNTVKVKEKIVALSGRLAEINGAATTEEKKALAETYFDIPSLLDYELIQCAVADTDSIYNNCQWVTYDGIKWAACEYDKDDTFGNHTWLCDVRKEGGWCRSALGNSNIANDNPIGLIRTYYQDDAKARWEELVNTGIFTIKNIINLADEWIKRIGVVNYIKEYNKWDSRANRPTNINTDYWEYYGQRYNDSRPTYNSSTSYVAGDKVKLSAGYGLWFVFTCIQDCTGEAPCLDANTSNMGWKGSVGQLYEFIEDNLNAENDFFESL